MDNCSIGKVKGEAEIIFVSRRQERNEQKCLRNNSSQKEADVSFYRITGTIAWLYDRTKSSSYNVFYEKSYIAIMSIGPVGSDVD